MKSFKWVFCILLFLLVFGSDLCAECPKSIENLTLFNVKGKQSGIDCSFRTALIINFWATWCAPCRAEIPQLNEIYHEYKTRGIDIVGISLDSIRPQKINSYVKSLKIEYPIFIGRADEVQKKMDVVGIPATIIVDGKGKIYRKLVGYHTKDEIVSVLEELIKKLNVKD